MSRGTCGNCINGKKIDRWDHDHSVHPTRSRRVGSYIECRRYPQYVQRENLEWCGEWSLNWKEQQHDDTA